MTPQCVMLTRLFLLIAVPLTVVWWGGFWVVRRHWHAVAWVQGERRRFRWLILWSAIALAELAVLVCVAAGATPALAGSVRCTTSEVKSLGRLQTLCDDGTRAVHTWNKTLARWESTITPPPGKICTGRMNSRTRQWEGRCR